MLLESIYKTNDMDKALAYIEGMANDPSSSEITAAVEKFFEREEGKFQEFADGNGVAEMFTGYFSESEPFNFYENNVTCDSAIYKVALNDGDVFLTARFELSWTASDTTMPMIAQRVFSSREPQGYGHAHIHVRGACGELDEQMNGYAYEDMKEAFDVFAAAFYVDPATRKLYGNPYYY